MSNAVLRNTRLDLLEIINASVVLDENPVGLRGTICFGIATSRGARRWQATFGQTIECGFVERFSPGADVTVLTDEETARVLLEGGDVSGRCEIVGDRAFLRSFLFRYIDRGAHLARF